MFYLIADEETNKKLQINQAQYDHMLANARRIEERLGGGIKVMPTYHPAYLLRTPAAKKDVWADMKKVMAELGIDAPPQK